MFIIFEFIIMILENNYATESGAAVARARRALSGAFVAMRGVWLVVLLYVAGCGMGGNSQYPDRR